MLAVAAGQPQCLPHGCVQQPTSECARSSQTRQPLTRAKRGCATQQFKGTAKEAGPNEQFGGCCRVLAHGVVWEGHQAGSAGALRVADGRSGYGAVTGLVENLDTSLLMKGGEGRCGRVRGVVDVSATELEPGSLRGELPAQCGVVFAAFRREGWCILI